MRRVLLTTALLSLAIAAVPAPGVADHGLHLPDGVTAKISFAHHLGSLVVQPEADGTYLVFVSVFQKVDGAWSQVEMDVTLRVFTWGDHMVSATPTVAPPAASVEAEASIVADWTDRVSVPFTSSALGPVGVSFPASAIQNTPNSPNGMDVFVTFSELGGNPVPTSHHNVVKNAAIDRALFDVADALDYHGSTRPIGV